MFSWIMTIVIVIIGFIIIYLIKMKQDREIDKFKENHPGERMSLNQKAKLYSISAFAAGSVFVINFLMKFIMRKFSMGEKHDT
jgi:prepilin signal peptidase PulO-like enzyme (type II secretory pathway)